MSIIGVPVNKPNSEDLLKTQSDWQVPLLCAAVFSQTNKPLTWQRNLVHLCYYGNYVFFSVCIIMRPLYIDVVQTLSSPGHKKGGKGRASSLHVCHQQM